MTFGRATLLLLLLGALGCSAETFGDGDILVDPNAPWVVEGDRLPGSVVVLSAEWITKLPDSLALRIDDRPVVRVGRPPDREDALAVPLPIDLEAGSHRIELVGHPFGTTEIVGTVNTGGFTAMRYVRGSIFSVAQVLPQLPGIVAPAADRSGVLVVDARSGTVKSIPMNEQFDGLGSTFAASSFVSNHGIGWRRTTWLLGQARIDSAYLGWAGAGPIHELAPGVRLQAVKGGYSYLGSTTQIGYGYPEHVTYSGDDRWAVPDHWRSDSGVLLWDRQSASYEWMPRWRRVRTAFLPNSELVVVGSREGEPYDYTQPIWLARIDPATRTVLDSVDLGANVGVYPSVGTTSQGWIVISWGDADRLETSIRDPHTLGEIGRASTPGVQGAQGYTFLLIDDPTTRRWYLVAEGQRETIAIATFQYPD